MAAVTLFEALENIPDHRTKKGRRYPLTAIVAISLAAMLSGAKDLRAIFFRGRQLTPTALQGLASARSAGRPRVTNVITMFAKALRPPSWSGLSDSS